MAVADYRDIGVADLMLDGQNPRHASTQGQRDAIAALLGSEPHKLVELAKDVVSSGVSPIDLVLVLKSGAYFTVLEGNRRVAALKLLTNPSLAPTPVLQKRFGDLAKGATLPLELRCAVVGSRDEGRHWMELRHTGERGGAGIVPWNAEATHRFAGRHGSQADKALALIDALERSFPNNTILHQNLEKVRKGKLTTFGRVVSDPSVREDIGIEIYEGEVLTHFPAKAVEKAVGRIASDLAGGLTVTDLKSKQQRKAYLGEIQNDLPDPSQYLSHPKPLRQLTSAPLTKKTTAKTAPAPVGNPPPLFDGVVLTSLGGKVSAVLRELQHLDIDRYPNASAALIRVVLELAVGQVFDLNNWKQAGTLKAGVNKCLLKIDPSHKDLKYQAVRAGLQDGTSVLAVATIQAFLHNPHFHPTGTELRTIAANYAPFLAALDSLV